MQFASAVTRCETIQEATGHLVSSIRRQMRGEIDLLCVFLTPEHQENIRPLSRYLRLALSPRVLLGCTCEGIIGGDREIEREPGISVLAGRLPGATLNAFHIGMEEWESLLDQNSQGKLKRILGFQSLGRDTTQAYLVFADPFTTPATELLQTLEDICPGIPVLGGMVSGAQQAGQNLMLLNGAILEDGAIGVRIGGQVRVDAVVSQGCRPVGETFLVTKAEGCRIATLSGNRAFESSDRLLRSLPPDDWKKVETGLYMGVVVNEYQSQFGRGDFLVSPVHGYDRNTGEVLVDTEVRAGQTVQYHLRDASTAEEELRALMQTAARDETAPAGGMLFSDSGRGVRLFDMPGHDVRRVLEAVPETPLAGFFAQGEFGPIGGRNFLHQKSLSVVLFRPSSEAEPEVWPSG